MPFATCCSGVLRCTPGSDADRAKRARDNLAWREAAAGAWLAAAFFTKFNYGLLLAFGLFLDWLCEALSEKRAARLGAFLARSGFLCLVPALALTWWFFFPFPENLDTARSHRDSLIAFLIGNRQLGPTPWQQKALFGGAYLAVTARLAALQLLAICASLRGLFSPGTRVLWLVFLVFLIGVAVCIHDLHLDRFLIPGGRGRCSRLAALGLGWLLPRRVADRWPQAGPWPALASRTSSASRFPGWIARPSRTGSQTLELMAPQEVVRAMQAGNCSDPRAQARPSRPARGLDTNGLLAGRPPTRSATCCQRGRSSPERAASCWLGGQHANFSPASLHLALLRSGQHDRERFLALMPTRPLHDHDRLKRDPGLSARRSSRRPSSSGFDVVFATGSRPACGTVRRLGRSWSDYRLLRLVDHPGLGGGSASAASRFPGPSRTTSHVALYALRPQRRQLTMTLDAPRSSDGSKRAPRDLDECLSEACLAGLLRAHALELGRGCWSPVRAPGVASSLGRRVGARAHDPGDDQDGDHGARPADASSPRRSSSPAPARRLRSGGREQTPCRHSGVRAAFLSARSRPPSSRDCAAFLEACARLQARGSTSRAQTTSRPWPGVRRQAARPFKALRASAWRSADRTTAGEVRSDGVLAAARRACVATSVPWPQTHRLPLAVRAPCSRASACGRHLSDYSRAHGAAGGACLAVKAQGQSGRVPGLVHDRSQSGRDGLRRAEGETIEDANRLSRGRSTRNAGETDQRVLSELSREFVRSSEPDPSRRRGPGARASWSSP